MAASAVSTAAARFLAVPHRVAALRSGVRLAFRELPAASTPTTGAPVSLVLAHGALTNSRFWRHVAAPLADAGYRILAPELPLGAQPVDGTARTELPATFPQLTPRAVAGILADFMDETVGAGGRAVLVANDSGGAISQMLVSTSRGRDRVAGLVLTNCDSHDNFLPTIFAATHALPYLPGSLTALAWALQFRAVRSLPFVLGWLAKRDIDRETIDSYRGSLLRSSEVRSRFNELVRGASSVDTLAAASAFGLYTKPVLVAWAREDKAFPLPYGRRLAKEFPGGSLVSIDDSYGFVPEDNPAALVDAMVSWLRAHDSALRG